ncbi:arginine--tRNA ligase [Bacteroidota bacterium]
MMQTEYIYPVFESALEALGVGEDIEIDFDIPKIADHGDLSTNIAMKLAKELKKVPRQIAVDIISKLNYNKDLVQSVDIAGPGFINIKFTEKYYSESLKELQKFGDNLGRTDLGKGQKVNVEYVSCNPTGLLHLGHGRNAALGDTVANFYEWLGYDVTREYYFNNAGNQMNVLAASIYARYMQALVNPDFPFPENGYQGDYINEIANELIDKQGDIYKTGTEKDKAAIRKFGEEWCFREIKKTLQRMKIDQDVFYNESTLYEEGKIEKVINDLKAKELAYEKDGALWLALTKLGLEEDRVIVKSTGEPTYRLPDIAYHREKFERGFDIIVDVFGSDHIATVPDVKAGVEALGYDKEKIRVIIYQFVTLTENGEQVKMSKRTGRSYTLDDLLDEVGTDVARFFFIMRSSGTHLEFDLGLAKEQSDKNPVFYLQYAHARICSIFQNAKEKGINIETDANYDLLKDKQEINLIKVLMRFNEVVQSAAIKCQPQILVEYLHEVAAAFHAFYHDCRIIGIEENLMQARFKLAEVTRTAMKNGLTILGVSSPERM